MYFVNCIIKGCEEKEKKEIREEMKREKKKINEKKNECLFYFTYKRLARAICFHHQFEVVEDTL